MTRPKARPITQNSKPRVSSLWPSMPRKVTDERSGSLRLASPPVSGAGWARAEDAVSINAAKAKEKNFPKRLPQEEKEASQGRIGPPLERLEPTTLFRAVPARK